jgi:hypothetical protein
VGFGLVRSGVYPGGRSSGAGRGLGAGAWDTEGESCRCTMGMDCVR